MFVGSFDLPTIKPLVERYVATLPSINRKEAARDVGIQPPAGVVEKHVTKGIDPKSQVSIVFTGPFQDNERNRQLVSTMAALLSGDLNRTLREDLGRNVRHQRGAKLQQISQAGVQPGHQLRLRSRTDAGVDQGGVQGH